MRAGTGGGDGRWRRRRRRRRRSKRGSPVHLGGPAVVWRGLRAFRQGVGTAASRRGASGRVALCRRRRNASSTSARAYGLLFLTSLIWAGNFIAGKVALEVLGPITLTALRTVLATGVLLWYVRFSYQTWPSVGRATSASS